MFGWFEYISIGVMIIFTLLAFRKNAVMYLSFSFTIVYVIEIFLLYTQPKEVMSFFMALSAKYPPDIGIFSGIYLHSLNPGHIFFNILIFFLAGMPFESRIGSKKFTLIFLVSGIVANILYSSFLFFSGIESYLIGASGAIFGIMGAFVVMYPDDEITMFLGPVLMPRVKVKYAVLAFMAVEFIATLFWVNDNIAHGAHVIGAVTGALMGYYFAGIHRTHEKREKNLNYHIFENLADTPKLREIYERIKSEENITIRDVWIEKFFEEKCGKFRKSGKYVICNDEKYEVWR